MTDLQRDAMLEALETIEDSNLTPKSTWSRKKRVTYGTGRRWVHEANPQKLARRIQMNSKWKKTNKHVKTDCGIHMPPKEAQYRHSGQSIGVTTPSWQTSDPNASYWWNPSDNKAERAIDVIHAHAHVQGNTTDHGPAFAQAVFEIVDSQYQDPGAKKIVNNIYHDLGIIKGRGRKVTAKPRSTAEDYLRAAPGSAEALRKLIEGLS